MREEKVCLVLSLQRARLLESSALSRLVTDPLQPPRELRRADGAQAALVALQQLKGAPGGLAREQLPSLEGIGRDGGDSEIRSTFAPPWDDIDLYVFMKVTWAS